MEAISNSSDWRWKCDDRDGGDDENDSGGGIKSIVTIVTTVTEGKVTMKNVQIPYELFVDLVLYHLNDEDGFEDEIRQGLERKLDAMLNRQLYSRYKTAPTEEQREQARQEYLDRRGVPESYRWTASPWEL